MSVASRVDHLQRLGKYEEARLLIQESSWFRCGNIYYKPSSKIILDGNKVLSGELDISKCNKVPFSAIDGLEAKVGIRVVEPSKTPVQPTKKGCCK
jgi:hypothetical protein